mgnify:CR=1 FL=1
MREVAQLVGEPACLSNTGSESPRVLLLSTDYCISVPQGCSELLDRAIWHNHCSLIPKGTNNVRYPVPGLGM